MSVDARITDHYARGDLLAAIRAGVEAMGKSPATVDIADLAPVDEFHIGGRRATTELAEALGLRAGTSLLDIGCGLGGAARFFASHYGCDVTGLDLTPAYVDVARTLTGWIGLESRARFEVGSAVAMPFDDASFDGATQIHVGMNVADKAALFAEVRRVLRPGGRLGVYDVLRMEAGDIPYPVPWSSDASTSFVDDLATYRAALEAAGFVVTRTRARRDLAEGFFEALRTRAAQPGGPPPLGLHLVMGPQTALKVANMVAAVTAGTLAPVEILARA